LILGAPIELIVLNKLFVNLRAVQFPGGQITIIEPGLLEANQGLWNLREF
jgi:hypothetical protein